MASKSNTRNKIQALFSSFLHDKEEILKERNKETNLDVTKNPGTLSTLCQPRNIESFYNRVETFSPFTWFMKPLYLSPQHCALYGWENTDVDLLVCVSCKATLDGIVPTDWDSEIYNSTCLNLKTNIINGHSKFCPWRDSPCPEAFLSLPMKSVLEWKKYFETACANLLKFENDLPVLKREAFQDMELTEDILSILSSNIMGSDGSEDNSYHQDIVDTVCVMALCGWNSSGPDNIGVLSCAACHREAGLWNFMSLKTVSQIKSGVKGNGGCEEETGDERTGMEVGESAEQDIQGHMVLNENDDGTPRLRAEMEVEMSCDDYTKTQGSEGEQRTDLDSQGKKAITVGNEHEQENEISTEQGMFGETQNQKGCTQEEMGVTVALQDNRTPIKESGKDKETSCEEDMNPQKGIPTENNVEPEKLPIKELGEEETVETPGDIYEVKGAERELVHEGRPALENVKRSESIEYGVEEKMAIKSCCTVDPTEEPNSPVFPLQNENIYEQSDTNLQECGDKAEQSAKEQEMLGDQKTPTENTMERHSTPMEQDSSEQETNPGQMVPLKQDSLEKDFKRQTSSECTSGVKDEKNREQTFKEKVGAEPLSLDEEESEAEKPESDEETVTLRDTLSNESGQPLFDAYSSKLFGTGVFSPVHSRQDSLIVEVGDGSLGERLESLQSELNETDEGLSEIGSCDNEAGEPTSKRLKTQDVEKIEFNVLTEHRNWCPWVTAVPSLTAGDTEDGLVQKYPGWQILLKNLSQCCSPQKHSPTQAPPSQVWKSMRRMFLDCQSTILRGTPTKSSSLERKV